MCEPTGRKEIKQRIVHALPVFKSFLNSKAFGVERHKTY
jgi:hypothetical protein